MDVVEVSAKTVGEATEKALAELGVSRDQVRITVLNEGKAGGLFGLGAEEAEVRVERITVEVPLPQTPSASFDRAPSTSLRTGRDEAAQPTADVTRIAAETLGHLLKLMEVEGTVVASGHPDETGQEQQSPLSFNIEGEDLGILIGRRGQTLAALQYMLRLIVGHQTNNWVPIVVDAEGYKERRNDALKTLALRIADQVKVRGAPFTLEPMPPYERRLVHLALAEHPAVFTESTGEGESRKVVIRPKQPSSGARDSFGSAQEKSFDSAPPAQPRTGQGRSRPSGPEHGGSTLGRGGYESRRSGGFSGDKRQQY